MKTDLEKYIETLKQVKMGYQTNQFIHPDEELDALSFFIQLGERLQEEKIEQVLYTITDRNNLTPYRARAITNYLLGKDKV